MPRFLLPPHAPTVLATATGDLVAVRRVYCVGRNYGAHAREMGGDPAREPPFFFSKPADAVTTAARIPFPPATAELHHEVELVAVVGRGGVDIPAAHALEHVFGYTVGIDLTRRDLQEVARKAGRPWDMAKGFDHSAPCGVVRPATEIGHPAAGAIALEVNGEGRQSGDLAAMIWPVADVVAQLSALVALEAGDLIFTGTPAGVGPVRRGDRLLARIEGVGGLEVMVG